MVAPWRTACVCRITSATQSLKPQPTQHDNQLVHPATVMPHGYTTTDMPCLLKALMHTWGVRKHWDTALLQQMTTPATTWLRYPTFKPPDTPPFTPQRYQATARHAQRMRRGAMRTADQQKQIVREPQFHKRRAMKSQAHNHEGASPALTQPAPKDTEQQ